MNLKGKSVLITGAEGFIGSHLTEQLVTQGAKTKALVYYKMSGSSGWLDESQYKNEIEIIAGDINDYGVVSGAMRNIDVVFHLAALIGIPYSYQAPESYVRTNVLGTHNILQAAKSFNLERVLVVSTSEVYGTARYVPIDEKHPLQAQSPYAASKIGAEKLAESYYCAFGLPAVVIRPFNTFGPRQSARAVIPSIITQCLVGKKIRLGNLTPTRDLNYVANTAEGLIAAAISPKAIGKTINIGSGREISIGDLVALIGKIIGKEPVIESDALRLRPNKSEVERLLADNTLARELLGWEPKYSLEEGLKLTISWFEKNLGKYRPGNYEV